MPTRIAPSSLPALILASFGAWGCSQADDPADLSGYDRISRPDLGVESLGDGAGGAGGGQVNPDGCPSTIEFTGQVVGPEAEVPNGGVAAFTPWPEVDTGVGAVKAAFPATDMPVAVDIEITEAVVTATSFYGSGGVPASQTRFWLEDANGAVEFFLDSSDAESVPPFDMQVGNVVSLRVTEVTAYQGKGQVAKAADWTLVDVDQPVHIFEPDRALIPDDIDRVVRVTGVLEGNPTSCGGSSRCWNTFNYGMGTGIFRSSSDFLSPGQCVTFVGPVRVFNSDIQFDTINFDWHTNHVEQ